MFEFGFEFEFKLDFESDFELKLRTAQSISLPFRRYRASFSFYFLAISNNKTHSKADQKPLQLYLTPGSKLMVPILEYLFSNLTSRSFKPVSFQSRNVYVE